MNTETRNRNSIDSLLTDLRERLAQPGGSLLPLLTTMSRFSKYSLANQMLIFGQRPDATCVMGYRSWLKAGYQVRRGEKGIAIYAPMRFTREDPGTLEVNVHTGFRVAYVFDLAQVDPLPGTDPALIAPTAAGSSDAHRCLEQLKVFLFGHNVELEYKLLSAGLMGYTDGRRITCALDQPAHVEFATLAHETTHLLLHFDRSGSGSRPDLTTRETEAEAVTFLLCAQLGLDGVNASVDYIRSYRGTSETLDASLERIRATAVRLSAEINAITFDVAAATELG